MRIVNVDYDIKIVTIKIPSVSRMSPNLLYMGRLFFPKMCRRRESTTSTMTLNYSTSLKSAITKNCLALTNAAKVASTLERHRIYYT